MRRGHGSVGLGVRLPLRHGNRMVEHSDCTTHAVALPRRAYGRSAARNPNHVGDLVPSGRLYTSEFTAPQRGKCRGPKPRAPEAVVAFRAICIGFGEGDLRAVEAIFRGRIWQPSSLASQPARCLVGAVQDLGPRTVQAATLSPAGHSASATYRLLHGACAVRTATRPVEGRRRCSAEMCRPS